MQKPTPSSFVIADALDAVRVHAIAKEIILEVDLTTEPFVVGVDPLWVRQIAWNLLNNAVKFTPQGGRVTVRFCREGNGARLEVEESRQIDVPTGEQEEIESSLSFIRQLAELNGGRIEAASEGIDQGGCVIVWLPVDFAAPEPNRFADQLAVASIPNGALSGVHILVVDDSAENGEALRCLVETAGGEARSATSGAEALQIVDSEDFDLIISDISMPGINGYQLLKELRNRPHTASVPAIALTGYGEKEDAERTREAGYFAHLTKPIIVDQLLGTVLAAVRQYKNDEG